MDFMAICTGLGLALAAGLIIGVVVPPIVPAWGALVAAAPLGVIACGAALNGADEEIWPALLIGPAAAGGAALITRDVVGGAARRARPSIEDVQAQTPTGVAAIVVLAQPLPAAGLPGRPGRLRLALALPPPPGGAQARGPAGAPVAPRVWPRS
jgi:hypothetical protein